MFIFYVYLLPSSLGSIPVAVVFSRLFFLPATLPSYPGLGRTQIGLPFLVPAAGFLGAHEAETAIQISAVAGV